MRRIWVRIFAAMVIANALAGLGVVLAYQSQMERHRGRGQARDGAAIAHLGLVTARAVDEDGAGAATDRLARLEARAGLRVALLDADGAPVVGEVAPSLAAAATEAAARHPAGDPFPLTARWQAVRLGDGRVAVGESEPRENMFGLSPPLMQLVVVGLLSAVLSLLLSRWISGPLRTLRLASRRLLAGPGAVRALPSISPLADAEARALAADFDRMAERIEGLLASRERLLRDVSHELRSPLARLSVALELARESSGEEARPMLDRIEKEAERLNALIALVLTMAKLEQAPEAARRDEVPLDELVEEICADAAFEAGAQGLTVELVEHEALTLEGNEEILRQAIENAVRNAIRWTPEGTAVEVSVTRGDGPEPWAMIRVRDHGPGVPEADLEEIFQPFARLQAARERSAGGAGIGLAITARALRVHGGHASAENAQGGGLRVILALPLT